MEYIVFDLEWNQPYYNDIQFLRKANMPITGEIIQIGAVKVDDQLNVVDTFNLIIKPQILTSMHRHVRSLTGITDADLALGVAFDKGLQHFAKWCGSDPILLSWGADDLMLLIDNMRLYKLEKTWKFKWYDAQIIYSYESAGEVKQIALSKALLERDLPQDLEAHNALHDARYTVRILKGINMKEGLAHYDEMNRSQTSPLIYPDSLLFAVYDGYKEKKTIFKDHIIKKAYCPVCKKEIKLNAIEHTTGNKYLAIGHCEQHGEFSVLWRIQKYTGPKNETRFYVCKNITRTNVEIQLYYDEKARLNKIKEEKYHAFLRNRVEARAKYLKNIDKGSN